LFVAVLPQQLHAQNWRDSLSVLNKQIAASSWDTDLHLRKAAVHLELYQWQYAIDEYSLVLEHQVQNPAALFYRAYAATHLRHYEAARHDYETFLGLFPHHAEARMSLSYVLQQMGRQTEALDQLNTVVELQPDSAISYATRAALEQDLQQYDAALYDWQQAIQLEPQNADYVASRVDLLLRLRRNKEARRDLDAAVRRGLPRGLLRIYYAQLK
jgi:tetratricopeptide (TPR) repeat protein